MIFLSSYKPLVDNRLISFLGKKQKEFAKVNHWGTDVIEKLLPFVSTGKTIRGGLLCYAYSLFEKIPSDSVLDAAAALELFHSGFLIHDDIMDGDTMRRGRPTLHVQYTSDALAMCIGDLCFFLGNQLLPVQVQKYVSRELSYVTIAQMQDVAGAQSQKDILSLYTYKTARYSFSVPLAVGARLAKAEDETISKLEALGEYMGILFQIRDDEIDGTPSPLSNAIKKQLIQKADKKIYELPIDENRIKELAALVEFCHNRQA